MQRYLSRDHARDPLWSSEQAVSEGDKQVAAAVLVLLCYWTFPIWTPPHHTHCQNSLKRQTVVGIIFPLENLLGICYFKLKTTLKQKERKSSGEKEETKQAHAATEQCIFLFYFGLFFTELDSDLIHPPHPPQMPKQIWTFFWLSELARILSTKEKQKVW